jgi:hypothetical protein
MKIKALITMEVELDTNGIPVQTGLGENSNPQHVSRSAVKTAKADFIWDTVYNWVSDKEGFIEIKEVRVCKESVGL